MKKNMQYSYTLKWILGLMLTSTMVMAQNDTEERIARLEEQIVTLSNELEKQRFSDAFPKLGESKFGLGPAASKVYNVQETGVSIGGYGEGVYHNRKSGDEADFLRAILYAGYKYSDKWVFNSEIEFEHASTSEEGSASVEFAYVEYLHSDALNFRSGILLTPMGFINELHEPTTFYGVNRPQSERYIIPSTWRENGLGIFGDLGEQVSYKLYVLNGLEGEAFAPNGLRGGRQKGSEAKADDLAGVLQLEYSPNYNLSFGGSIYHGGSGQDLVVDVPTTIAEVHVSGKYAGFSFRALGAIAELDDVAELNRIIAGKNLEEGETLASDAEIDSIGERLEGWYAELGYDILNVFDTGEHSFVPFVRYESIDTQAKVPAGFDRSGARDYSITTVGIHYQPIDEIVFKADYEMFSDSDDNAFNLGMGYVF